MFLSRVFLHPFLNQEKRQHSGKKHIYKLIIPFIIRFPYSNMAAFPPVNLFIPNSCRVNESDCWEKPDSVLRGLLYIFVTETFLEQYSAEGKVFVIHPNRILLRRLPCDNEEGRRRGGGILASSCGRSLTCFPSKPAAVVLLPKSLTKLFGSYSPVSIYR